ncbi:hypothetical protein DICPUDRAFT_82654 [Dictyostelium purpureum]|uniref:Profilin n=1 Tax=Dictyostelium purpureum TaxID=5786 RepID=F0ZX62_DICPU|nr:uncharacterized protein DICPUDRAFT_82654 [Dictyostelium purpureum]EGC31474.1 hypothetical protein DICPUDRAFT_82654 [Dictyostelium purpureum]|eukprot:XP_003292013.1 hypothetical protein DICPUDRAFT_82654 [Dictyostelium purpureum]
MHRNSPTTNTNRNNPVLNRGAPNLNNNNNNSPATNTNRGNPILNRGAPNLNNNNNISPINSPIVNRNNPPLNRSSPTINTNNNPNTPPNINRNSNPALNRSNPTINTNTNTNTPPLNRSYPSINTNVNTNTPPPAINRNNTNTPPPNTNVNTNNTNDNKPDDKSKDEKDGNEINWQDIVDRQIVGSGYIDFGSILDINGKVLASKNITINEEEAKQFIKDLKNNEQILKLAGKKYNTMINKDKEYYHGKEGNNGIFCLKTKSNYIIGHYCEYHHYDNPFPKKSQIVIETVAKNMKEINL